MGRIIDQGNSLVEPLVIFNTQKFDLFEYNEKLREYQKIEVEDENNFGDYMPKNFKTAYLGNEFESYLIAGGFDSHKFESANQTYLLERGKLS
jgi:SAM-dependent MidA family methyltransferase